MRNKQAKKLRKMSKTQVSHRKGYSPDYRKAKEKTKLVYFDKTMKRPDGKEVSTGEKEALTVNRFMIVNAKKIQYRRIKKEFKKLPKGGRK